MNLQAIATDNAWNLVKMVSHMGMTIDEAVESKIYDLQQDGEEFDESEATELFRAELISTLSNSAEELWTYALNNEGAYLRDYDDVDEYGTPVVVRVIEFNGEQFHVVASYENDSVFHHDPK